MCRLSVPHPLRVMLDDCSGGSLGQQARLLGAPAVRLPRDPTDLHSSCRSGVRSVVVPCPSRGRRSTRSRSRRARPFDFDVVAGHPQDTRASATPRAEEGPSLRREQDHAGRTTTRDDRRRTRRAAREERRTAVAPVLLGVGRWGGVTREERPIGARRGGPTARVTRCVVCRVVRPLVFVRLCVAGGWWVWVWGGGGGRCCRCRASAEGRTNKRTTTRRGEDRRDRDQTREETLGYQGRPPMPRVDLSCGAFVVSTRQCTAEFPTCQTMGAHEPGDR